MDETHALRESDRVFRLLPRRADDVRARSASLVMEPYGLYRRGLVLLDAAPRIAAPGRSAEVRTKAVLSCLGVQVELLWTGWQLLLNGHYAAAGVPCRLISELIDYIWAASLDEAVAQKLLTNQQVRVGDARATIERLISADPDEVRRWRDYRKRVLDEYNATAHARAPLLHSATHARGERRLVVGHALDRAGLSTSARIYAQLSVNATLSVGVAFGDHLPDDGAWSTEQRRLMADWDAFMRTDTGGHSVNVDV